jgi:drug/metabolite transporter (DMT)-like permease
MNPTRLFMLTLLAMIAFASNSLLCRAALKETGLDAASFTFIRIFSGAVALWFLMEFRRKAIVEQTATPPSPQSSPKGRGDSFSLVEKARMRVLGSKDAGNWPSAAALFAYAATFSFAYISLSAGTGALLLFAAVQATMILWGWQHGERLRVRQLVGLVLALTGLVALLFPGLSAPPLSGSILMLGAGVAWGIYSLRGKAAGDAIGATTGNFLRAVPLAAVMILAFLPWTRLDRAGIGYAILSGAIASGVGYVIWYSALAGLKAASAATVQLSVPVLATTGGILLLGEPITFRYLVASIAVLGGIGLVVIEKNHPGKRNDTISLAAR